MASVAVTPSQDGNYQAQQQVGKHQPCIDGKPSLHISYDEDSGKEIKVSSIASSPQDLDPATETPDREWKAGKEEWMIILVIAFVGLMVALDATILVSALPAIASDLNGDATDAFWAGTAYLLTQSVFQPFIVALSDVFGRRTFYLISLFFFTAGTLICCLSQDFNELLAGRAVQGVGGGGILALSLVITTDIVPLRQRPIFTGINQISWALGSITGPLIGGLFVQHSTWRWIFYLNFPFCGIGFLSVPLVMRLHARRAPLKERLMHVDWIGGFLFISSTCSFLIGLTWGGAQYPWSSWRTLLPLIAGLGGIVATLMWERYRAARPFIRLELFNSYSALAAYIGSALQGLIMFCELYYIPFYLESVKGLSPTTTGVAVMPMSVALIPTSVIVGMLMTRTGRFRWAIWIGWAILTAGTGLLILLDVQTQTHVWVLIFVVVGLGHGFILMSLNFSIQAMSDTRNVAYAVAMYTFTRTFGMCIGVAAGGTVFQNQVKKHLADLGLLTTGVAADTESFVATLRTLPKSSPEYQNYILAYAKSFENVFEVLTAVAGLAGLLSLLIRKFSMDKELDSEHVLRQGEQEISAAESSPVASGFLTSEAIDFAK